MTRLEYIQPGGIRLRFVNVAGLGRVLLPTAPLNALYLPQLTGKTILGVYKDGIGWTKILQGDTIFTPTPSGKHVTFNPPYGMFVFPEVIEAGETVIILYQDTPP